MFDNNENQSYRVRTKCTSKITINNASGTLSYTAIEFDEIKVGFN